MDVRSIECDTAFIKSKANVVQILLRSPPFENAKCGCPDGANLRVVTISAMRCDESLEDATFVVSSVLQKLLCVKG